MPLVEGGCKPIVPVHAAWCGPPQFLTPCLDHESRYTGVASVNLYDEGASFQDDSSD